MDTVIITGAGDEPALSVARRLCDLGMRVYALAANVPETGLPADEFVPVPCDLTSPRAVLAAVEKILEKESCIAGIVVAGQYLSDEFFEAAHTEEILGTLAARVASPLCVVRAALPSLIACRGNVVVISPVAGTPRRRALNAAADAALAAFAETLFEELRDTGVKTCRILLKENDGAPDPAARFTMSPQSRIHADIVADAVETVFRLRENNALTQMILRPQATRETPHIPVSAEPKIRALQAVELPTSEKFPPAETPIPTPHYRRPNYAPPKEQRRENVPENDDGFDDDYVDPELRYLVKQNPPQQNRAPENPNAARATNDFSPGQNRENGRSRRHRRNRHGKNRPAENGAMRISPPQFSEHQNPNAPAVAPEKISQNVPEKFSQNTPTTEARAENFSPEKISPEKSAPRNDSPVTPPAPAVVVPAAKTKRPRKPRAPKTGTDAASPEKKKREPRKRENDTPPTAPFGS